MTLTNTLDEIFFILFGLIDELFWPLMGILLAVVFVGFLLWVGSHARK